ncbi:testis-expressed protein 30 [Triplophysa rosa]|uniref:testis-expressed protein 30 n=1 Tax=Triplophysa rosa TaxID=992332 RepID=UPI002545EB2C|nr:testis-expressed protein 30 [Triplophysa rosa]
MMFSEENVRIPFEQKQLDGVFTVPADVTALRAAVVMTHGAGGDMHISHLETMARALACSGVLCLRFTCKGLNLAYRIRAYRAAVDYLKAHERYTPNSIFLGGRSMGARAAVAVGRVMCAEQEDAVQGLLCLSFPLHPPGKTHTHIERSQDLRALSHTPVLFVSGTADTMCEQKLMENVIKLMQCPIAVHWVKGASHGLTVRGRTEESVSEEVNSQIITWILEHKLDKY